MSYNRVNYKKGGMFMYASDYRRIAREKLGGHWGVSIGAAVIAALLGGLVSGTNVGVNWKISQEITKDFPLEIVMLFMRLAAVGSLIALVQFILGGVVRQGYCQFLLDQHDGQELNVKTLFSKFDRFGDGFVLLLLEGIYVALWSLLFVIPGIVAAYRYAMAPYIMAENPGMRPSEAIRASKAMMDGRKGRLFCLHLSFIGWNILCMLTLGIGNLWLNPYTNAAQTAFYREISKENIL